MRATSITTTGLYVEPSTFCPLDCALCYTAHTTQRLLPAEVIHRAAALMLEDHHTLGIFWCGLGEVFQDHRFPNLLDDLDQRYHGRLLHVVRTNGQARATLAAAANKVALVSLDLPRAFTARHRGRGYWDRAVAFSARHLAAHGQGLGIKCLVTSATLPAVARSFHALQKRLSVLSGLSIHETRRRSWLEPILPFPRTDVARIDNSAFVPRGGEEDPTALLEALARWLPEHCVELRERPRTLELSVTAQGLFSCCEAVVRIGDLDELEHLDHATVRARLEAAAPACETCPLEGVC